MGKKTEQSTSTELVANAFVPKPEDPNNFDKHYV
jgi:hypothetical protein